MELIAHLNLPAFLLGKEGHNSSLWQREVRRDFLIGYFSMSDAASSEDRRHYAIINTVSF